MNCKSPRQRCPSTGTSDNRHRYASWKKDASWWPKLRALEDRRRRLEEQAAAWALFVDEAYERIVQRYERTPAFVRAVERLCRARRSVAIDLIAERKVRFKPKGGARCEPYAGGLRILASTGDLTLYPADDETRIAASYIRIKGTFRRAGKRARVGFETGAGERVEVEASDREVAVIDSAGGRRSIEAPFDGPHTIELVVVGDRAVLRLDGTVLFPTAWKGGWPNPIFSGVEADLSELRHVAP